MRRTVITIVLLATMCTLAQAQVKLGVRGGFNLTDLSLDKEIIDSKNRSGFYVGPTLKVDLPALIGFDISALYDKRELEVGSDNTKINQQSVTIPLNLRLRVGLGSSVEAFAFAGPQVSFNIGDKDKVIDEAKQWKFKESAFSANFGVGVTLFKNLQVTANYNIALGNTADVSESVIKDAVDELKKHDAKTNAWQVGLAVFF